MTLRRFYAPPEAFSTDRTSVELSAEETRHLRDVLRLSQGDEVRVFDGAGQEFQAVLTQIERASAKFQILQQVEPEAPESPLALTLAPALLKGEKLELIIQKATELGVTRFIPVITSRTDVRPSSDKSSDKRVTRWRRIAVEAAKQCGRARLMEITLPVTFEDLIERQENDELRLMFAERAGTSLDQAMQGKPNPRNISVLLGPEGGWTDDEIASARSAGWQIVTLGGRTLRAETAAITVAAIIQHRFGDVK